ncbi:MAG: sigma-70 family RNA polymerase sigma factor [Oscillospiraceae bacterium]|nr:sigma-70 family RNA polymerase sigma factor [Oscillospiraceae bacterium]
MDHGSFSNASDEELTALLRSSDGSGTRTAVLTELFSRYIGLLKSLASDMCADPSDREDLLHEGMRGFIQAVDRFDCGGEHRFFPYMWSCVRNRMTDQLRRRDLTEELPDDVKSVVWSPEMSVIAREEIHDALSALSPLEASVLMMRYAGYTFSETGEKLRVTRRAAENAAARARQKLTRQRSRIYAL